MSQAVVKLSRSGRAFDPAEDGSIVWVDDEVIGFQCGCGNDEVLRLGVYEDSPAECPACHARLYYRQRIEVIQTRGSDADLQE